MKKNTRLITMLICLAAALLLPLGISSHYNQVLLNQTVVYIIVALGLNFTMGLSGSFDFSTAAIFGLGSYTTGLLTTKLGINPWIGVVAAIGMGAVVGRGGVPHFAGGRRQRAAPGVVRLFPPALNREPRSAGWAALGGGLLCGENSLKY